MRPSSLPMLAVCPKFNGENLQYDLTQVAELVTADRTFADAGTLRHTALRLYMNGDLTALDAVPEDQQDGLKWAAEYIRLVAPMADHPMLWEQKRHLILPDLTEMDGTPDLTCGNVLFDLKWRQRDYRAQMAAYSMMLFQNAPDITPFVQVHLLFADAEWAQTMEFTEDNAWDCIRPIVASVKDPKATETPCDYCGWCSIKANCKALLSRINAVLEGRPEWGLEQWHASAITTATEMGKALRISRCLAEWCEGIEYHAKEMAIKQGMIPSGYKIQTRAGNRFISSVMAAFNRMGMPQKEFLDACVCKPTALFKAYAALHGMKAKPAEREVETKLGGEIQHKPQTFSLVVDKSTNP